MEDMFPSLENMPITLEYVQNILDQEWYLNVAHLNHVHQLFTSFTARIGEEEREEFNTTKQLYLDAMKVVHKPAILIVEQTCKLTKSSSSSSIGISNETQSCTSYKEGQTDPEFDLIEKNDELQRENVRLTEGNKMIQEEKVKMFKALEDTQRQLTPLKENVWTNICVHL